MKFEELLRSALGCQSVRSTGRGGGGCISRGQAFIIDGKDHVFVKENDKAKVCYNTLLKSICNIRVTIFGSLISNTWFKTVM